MCLPIIINEKITGIVNVINKKNNIAYNEDDLELLTALVSQTAIVIDKAHLHKLAHILPKTTEEISSGLSEKCERGKS
ncbi:MAG TPA: GAF domain-containing protein [Candidatus Eremiobacteraeota bacterium]|nr:MAG: hypothetical protein BWY64_00147 [bacterium ADurb.Bin363]HPZ07643.1 GAF domain-containing protein [Candidatus Eremiobacteraeota bacterium]